MPHVTHNDTADGGNGAASNIDDFIRNKLATFITSTTLFTSGNNWTRSKSDVNYGTNQHEVFLTPPSNSTANQNRPPYVAFYTQANGFFCFPGEGYDGGARAYDQPPGPGCYPRVSANAPDFFLVQLRISLANMLLHGWLYRQVDI